MVGVRSRTHIQDLSSKPPKSHGHWLLLVSERNQVDLETTKSRGIPTFNAPHSNTRSVAELVIAEITVMLLRGIGDKSRAAA